MPTIQEFKIGLEVGRPITQPKVINADKAYDSNEIRNYSRSRGIVTNIPTNKRNRERPKIGNPFRLNNGEYARRIAVERFFGWIEAFRKVYPRYERLKRSYIGLIQLASGLILWKVKGWALYNLNITYNLSLQ